MRYRPFGAGGAAISAISLRLGDNPKLRANDWRNLIFAALENGINSFEVDGAVPALLDGAAQAFASVERRLLFIGWRLRATGGLPLTAQAVHDMIDLAQDRVGVERLDIVTLDDPCGNIVPDETHAVLTALRGARLIQRLAISGGGPSQDAQAASGAFEAIATPFNLVSDWVDRNRVRTAMARNMAVIGQDYWPEALRGERPALLPKPSLWRRRTDPLAGLGGYDFLNATPGWTAREICLSYALTEPSLATVQVSASTPATIEALAAVTERDLPAGCAAQIEMARFSSQTERQTKRRA